MSKKFVFRTLISIFSIWLILFPLNDLLFSLLDSEPDSRKPNPRNTINAYLRNCITQVYFLASEKDLQELNLSSCKDKIIGLNNGEFPVISNGEIASSEIIISPDSKNIIVNIGWHTKKRFLFSVWGETKWTSFNGEKFVQGKSELP